MADAATAPETISVPSNLTPPLQESENKTSLPPSQSGLSSSTNTPFSNPSPSLALPPSTLATPPPLLQPSFRPAGPPVPVPSAAITPLFTPLPAYQTPGVPPPGVNPILSMTMASVPEPGGGAPNPVPIASVQQLVAPPYTLAAPHMRYPLPVQSTYASVPQHFPQGAVLPPGIVRYPSPYAPIIRPAFPPRPLVGVMPPLARPLIGIRGPIIPHIVRPPAIPIVIPAEKPQTTVYVGKISSTVENDFILSLLQLCGPVKSWKRAQDPTNGTLKGFGFCEFEFAEGVLRALRLLNKLSVDGQELMLNVNQATRTYLERYLTEKKNESSKNSRETETEGSNKEETTPSGSVKEVEKSVESLKQSSDEEKKEGEKFNKGTPESTNFGIVTNEDVEADSETLEKLTFMIEERLKNKPLPPPPSQTAVDGPGNLNSEQRSGSRDRDSDINVAKDDSDDKNEDEKTAESKLSNDHDRAETSSPDRSRRHESSRDRDRESRRDKERELERYEKEREQERAKREKDREYKSREEEHRYKIREKDWETREREREHWRKREREKEKDRHQERKWEVMDQEHDSDDGYGKKRKYRTSDEERKRRQREKDGDLTDRMREEEEIIEMRLRAEEELHKKQQEALKTISGERADGHERATLSNETYFEDDKGVDQISDLLPRQEIHEGERILQNGKNDETVNTASDERLINNAPTRKLGFGLSGSGKRASVPSVFNEDEDEDEHKEKKMRPLVPIDYSTEEHQTGQSSILEGPSANMVAAADYVKHVSAFNSKEEKLNLEKEKDRRYHEKFGQRDRGRHEEGINNTREEIRKDNLDRERANKLRTPENQKLLDAKQLIDTIPKTKDELFSYQINWVIYKQNALHERMRPWISKKITDFLGEEEVTLVDYIVSSTQEHISADDMLERLQAILDDEAEMFVLKMWRMLIFEIKKVETGLAPKAKN